MDVCYLSGVHRDECRSRLLHGRSTIHDANGCADRIDAHVRNNRIYDRCPVTASKQTSYEMEVCIMKLQVKNICKAFTNQKKKKIVLENISFDVDEG